MKKIITLLILLLSAFYSHAQLRNNTKFFFVRIITFPNFDYDWYSEELKLDSANSNGDYFKILSYDNFSNSRDTYFVKQKDRIVYHDDDTLYNFNLGINDSFSMGWFGAPKAFKIHSSASVNIRGKSLSALFLANGSDSTRWIEGVGDYQLGILYPLKRFIDAGYLLKAVCRNDSLLWWNELGSDYFGPAAPDTSCDFNSLAQLVSLPQLNSKGAISGYPNPFSSFFNLQLESSAHLRLLDLNGRIVKECVLEPGLNQIDCSSLQQGIYFLHLNDGKSSFYQKLIHKAD